MTWKTMLLEVQSSIGDINWDEIIYIIVGAAIGFVASIAVIVLERIIDKKGNLNIFYKRATQRGSSGLGWGFDSSVDGRSYFTIPVVFELQNTSNVTRVIRDVSLLLYNEKKLIGKMHQLEEMHVTKRRGNEVTGEKNYNFGTDKGSYSFVLPPRSIQRQEGEYIFVVAASEKDDKVFNNVIIRYHDERNKAHCYKMMNVSGCWINKHYDMDDEWILLDRSKKCRYHY